MRLLPLRSSSTCPTSTPYSSCGCVFNRTCGACIALSSPTTSSTSGTGLTPPCEKPWPGSKASPAPRTS
jgi:hypothetical protein